jgi:hypothetical protein
MTVIGEILAGKALELVLRGGKAAVDQLLEYDPPKQLLAIIYEQYGERADLSRKDFFAWLEVEDLGDAIFGALGGDLIDGESDLLRDLIAPQLQNTSADGREELAGQIATSIFRLAPWVQEGLGEGIAHLSHKMDRQYERLLEAVGSEEDADGPISAIEALLRGPLVQIGREKDAQKAQELAEAGDLGPAAEMFMEIVTALHEAGLGIVAETYLGLAAELYAKAGDNEAAAKAILEVAEAQVKRGTSAASFTTDKLRKILPTESQWKADALDARISFAEDLAGSLEALRIATERSRTDDEGPFEHLANYTDLLEFAGEFDTILGVTADLTTFEPTNEALLRLCLNRLDSLDAISSPEASAGWDELLLAVDRGTEPLWAGLSWQRRGVSLAQAGEVNRCQDAYRRAMAAFSLVPGYQEQAADAFYSLQLAAIMNAAPWSEMELRALAYEQRGSPEAPVARAERLARQGMDHRIAGKLPDALRSYALALALHGRAGSLQGQLEVSEKLGELFLEAGRPAMALGFYVAAGKSKEAISAAKLAPSAEITLTLRPDGSRWERAATFAVIAEVGERLPAEFLAKVGPKVAAEAERDVDGFVAPQPAHQARLALGTILLGLPNDQRESALSLLTTHLAQGPFDVTWAAERSLVHATTVGLTDATKPLVEAFLADPHNSRIPIDFLAKRVTEDDAAREIIEAAASESTPALAVLSLADLVAGNEQLEDAAERAAKSLSEVINVERTQGSISVGQGRNFAQEAIAGRGASEEGRRAAIKRLLEIAKDSADSELNRQAAANALFNLADAMPPGQAETVIDQLRPLGKGEYPLSQWDQNIEDPLSRVRLSVHTPAALQSAAIGAIGRVLRAEPDLPRDPLAEAVAAAYQRGPTITIAAATDALALVTDLDLPVPLEAVLAHGDPGVRLAGLRCWQARNNGLPSDDLVVALMGDENVAVRHTLLLITAEAGEWELVEQFAEDDEHAMIRRLAERRLSENRVSPTTEIPRSTSSRSTSP